MKDLVRVDEKGRVLIPKVIRDALGINAGQSLRISMVNGKIVLEPAESIADRYFGVVKVGKWPENIDDFLNEVIQRWWVGSLYVNRFYFDKDRFKNSL